jgi:hypothetical protein
MKTMPWFITSIVPVWLLFLGLVNPSTPSMTDYYGFIGLPLALVLTIAFIGRTVRANDATALEKCAWIAALVVLFPFSIALPVFAYFRIVKPAKTAESPTGNSRIPKSKTVCQ